MAGCAFQKEGLIFNEKEEPQKLSINKLREIDLKAPLLSIAEEICARCDNPLCNINLDLINDKSQGDWTIALVEPKS